jgi:hypothetical protein
VNRNPKIENLKPFKKGQSGNPAGKPKLPNIEEAMMKIMGEEKDGKTALDAILAALRAKAAKGDIRAAEVLLNRGYGLPKQKVEVTGKDGGPMEHTTIDL